MGWLSQFFINPLMVAAGAGLLALPVLIHLINRWRYRRVRWGAMEFLLQSKKQNQRKLLLEQLLLLLLRTIAVAAIVALLARPFVDPGQLQVLRGERSHHLVLLDDSLSMQDRIAQADAFSEGVNILRRLAQEGARQPGTQALTVLLLSRPDQPLFTQAALDPPFLPELEGRLEKLKCTHQAGEFLPGLQAALDHLRQPAASKTLHLISDFRARDWDRSGIYQAMMQNFSQQHVTVNLLRATPARHENLAVTKLSGDLHVAAVNVPLRISVTIRNFGEQPASNVRLAVLQDGAKLPLSVAVEELKPLEEIAREFDVLFTTPGAHRLEVELGPDAFPGDNSRFLSLDLPTALPVLMISGNVADGAAQFLADALAPAKGLTGFAPVIETPEYLRRQPLDKFASIFMVNVPDLPADGLRLLQEYVQNGGGLCWYMGELVKPGFYQEKLFADGKGIFPVKLGAIGELKVDESNSTPDLVLSNHPLFRFFQGEENPFVADVAVKRYFSVQDETKLPTQTQVIGRLRNQAPLFIEKAYGRGKVLACLTTAGDAWTNWPQNPSYVLTQLELQKYLDRNQPASVPYVTGEAIEISLDPALYRNQVEVRTPDPRNVTRLNVTPQVPAAREKAEPKTGKETAAAPLLQEKFAETDLPGIYTVVRFRQDETSETQLLTFNVPTSESETSLASSEQLRSALGLPGVRIHPFGELALGQGKFSGQEVRDLLLLILAVVLIGEQLLAWKTSYHLPMREVAA